MCKFSKVPHHDHWYCWHKLHQHANFVDRLELSLARMPGSQFGNISSLKSSCFGTNDSCSKLLPTALRFSSRAETGLGCLQASLGLAPA